MYVFIFEKAEKNDINLFPLECTASVLVHVEECKHAQDWNAGRSSVDQSSSWKYCAKMVNLQQSKLLKSSK